MTDHEVSLDIGEVRSIIDLLRAGVTDARAALRAIDTIDVAGAVRAANEAGVLIPSGLLTDLTRVERDGIVRVLLDELEQLLEQLASLHEAAAGASLTTSILFADDAVVTSTGRRAAVEPAYAPEPVEASQTALRLLAELDDPRAVAQFVAELDASERALLVRSAPRLVAELAGVPVEHRLEARRRLTDQQPVPLVHDHMAGITAVLADEPSDADATPVRAGGAAAVVRTTQADGTRRSVVVHVSTVLEASLRRGLRVAETALGRALDQLTVGLIADGARLVQLDVAPWCRAAAAMVSGASIVSSEVEGATSAGPAGDDVARVDAAMSEPLILSFDECGVLCDALGLPAGPWPPGVTAYGSTALRRTTARAIESVLCARGMAERGPTGDLRIATDVAVRLELACRSSRLERSVVDDHGLTEQHEQREIADWCVTLDLVDDELVRLRWGAHRPTPPDGAATDRWVVERRGSLVTGSYRRESAQSSD